MELGNEVKDTFHMDNTVLQIVTDYSGRAGFSMQFQPDCGSPCAERMQQ